MDAKMTPEQAKSTLGWIKIQCDSQLKKEIDRIINYIESLAADADLGRETRKTQICFWQYTVDDGDCYGVDCNKYKVCRLRARKGGE